MTTVVRPIHFVRRGQRTKAVSAPDAAPIHPIIWRHWGSERWLVSPPLALHCSFL